jgi:adenylate cyclase
MGRDKNGASTHDRSMVLSSTLSWLVDAAAEAAGADRVLAELGAHLLADGCRSRVAL